MNTTASQEIAAIFVRDIAKLRQEIEAFGEARDQLWAAPPGVPNSAGNLALHLEGNLREFIGRQLGAIAYVRTRPLEFSTKDLPVADIVARIAAVEKSIPPVVASLTAETLDAIHPENVLGEPITTRRFLVHLHGHLTYHLGQINYLRRLLSGK